MGVHCPDLRVALFGNPELGAFAEAVTELVRERDARDVEFRDLRGAFRTSNAALRTLTLKVPLLIEGQFKAPDAITVMLPPIWAIVPRTPALAQKRARVLLPVWKAADAALAKRTPPEPPIVREGVGAAEFAQLAEALPALELEVAHAATTLRAARIALRKKARLLDRWNKRFYGRLKAEARTDAALKAALKQIKTEPPSTRGKKAGNKKEPGAHLSKRKRAE